MSGQANQPQTAMGQPQQPQQQFMPYMQPRDDSAFKAYSLEKPTQLGIARQPTQTNQFARTDSSLTSYQNPPPGATITPVAQEQTPGYMPNQPINTVSYQQQPTPYLSGGFFKFAPTAELTKQQLAGRQTLNSRPWEFIAPQNISFRPGFYQELQNIQNQFLPQTSPGKMTRQQTQQYNQALSSLGGSADYQKAVREFLTREGMAGLLGATNV